MPDKVLLKITGDEALARKFRTLERNVARKVLRKSLRKAAKPIQQEAKRLAPRDSGELRRTIKIRSVTSVRSLKKNIGVIVRTGTREELGIRPNAPGYYPAVQEFGSQSRNIPAQPYMGEALESQRDPAFRILRKEVADGIRREAR